MLTFNEPWLAHGDALICFGDSLTAAPDGYVTILQQKLQLSGVKVVNAGRGGDKTPTALMRLQRDVIDRKPTAVSIALGTNDSQVGRDIWADEPMIPPAVYQHNLIWIIHVCRLAGIAKFSITPPLWRLEGPLWESMGDVMHPYCQAARDAASAMQARLVPADAAFANAWRTGAGGADAGGLLLTRDGGHLNPRGSQLIADTSLRAWGM